MAEKIAAHARSIGKTANELGTQLTNGLSIAEARARIERYGYNELNEKPQPDFFSLLLDQFKDLLIIILIACPVLFTFHSERTSVFKLGFFSTKTMNLAVIFSMIMVVAVIYIPFLQVIFDTVPLVLIDWL